MGKVEAISAVRNQIIGAHLEQDEFEGAVKVLVPPAENSTLDTDQWLSVKEISEAAIRGRLHDLLSMPNPSRHAEPSDRQRTPQG